MTDQNESLFMTGFILIYSDIKVVYRRDMMGERKEGREEGRGQKEKERRERGSRKGIRKYLLATDISISIENAN